ncbi:MAG: FtsX-like permease family protein [Mangrovicoccus sp.]|nr:FtsX-like permease family protein [Mangrovicoccus sp.]
MPEAWYALPVAVQDALTLVALLLPGVIAAVAVLWKLRPWPLIRDLARRAAGTSAIFVGLIAVSVALGTGLLVVERGLRSGSARAADRFDLIVAAPGSEVTLLLAAVYLQPSDVPLLTGAQFAEVAATPRVEMAAPIAFGDSIQGAPVVGTIAAFVTHLSGDLAEGRNFAAEGEAVVGALSPLRPGDVVEPAHGFGPAADAHAHAGAAYRVVGRMRPTGSPWDRAVLVPVETVWETHGLANGHAPDAEAGAGHRIGPPFDPAHFPGTPAILVRAKTLMANYNLKSEFTRPDMMAFFPGTVLAVLQARLGDLRAAMSALVGVTQVLVTVAVLAALLILLRLFARGFALLRALGAPARFVFAVAWGHAAAMILAGTLAGLALGFAAAGLIAAVVTRRTDVAIAVAPGWPELHFVAGFLSVTLLLALAPAAVATRRPILTDLRG